MSRTRQTTLHVSLARSMGRERSTTRWSGSLPIIFVILPKCLLMPLSTSCLSAPYTNECGKEAENALPLFGITTLKCSRHSPQKGTPGLVLMLISPMERTCQDTHALVRANLTDGREQRLHPLQVSSLIINWQNINLLVAARDKARPTHQGAIWKVLLIIRIIIENKVAATSTGTGASWKLP
jgi:hypothetical protein